jgi:hypothetical protein
MVLHIMVYGNDNEISTASILQNQRWVRFYVESTAPPMCPGVSGRNKYALPNRKSHLEDSHILDMIMTTYANGDLCSKLLFSAINRSLC